MNCIAAIEKMQEGAFVTCKGLASNESIHFYKGEYYLEDGTIVSINWIGERKNFEVIANSGKVNMTLLTNLHEYYKEHTSSFGNCNINFQACIEEKYACYGGPVSINTELSDSLSSYKKEELTLEHGKSNNGRGDFVNPFNRTAINHSASTTSNVESDTKEVLDSNESYNNIIKETSKDQHKEICRTKHYANLNYMEAMQAMIYGNFVSHIFFAGDESIHYYKGKYYRENGIEIDADWLKERKDHFRVLATTEKVNFSLLNILHRYYEGQPCNYKEGINYQACIQPKYAYCESVFGSLDNPIVNSPGRKAETKQAKMSMRTATSITDKNFNNTESNKIIREWATRSVKRLIRALIISIIIIIIYIIAMNQY